MRCRRWAQLDEMATNTFFNHTNPRNVDAGIYEDLLIEAIQIHGVDVYYLPRSIVELDKILNEPILSKFDEAYKIEVYPSDLEGFGGQDLLSKFGLQIKDEFTVIMAQRRFAQSIVPNLTNAQVRPYEGDLIFIPFANKLFEIRYVEDETQFYQLSRLPTWELRCELFTYEGQSIDTDVEDIDDIESDLTSREQVVVNIVSGTFKKGENVTLVTPSAAIITAEFVGKEVVGSDTIISLADITFPAGSVLPLVSGTTISGDKSGAEALIVSQVNLEDETPIEDEFADNSEFEANVDDLFDTSEDNPFGAL